MIIQIKFTKEEEKQILNELRNNLNFYKIPSVIQSLDLFKELFNIRNFIDLEFILYNLSIEYKTKINNKLNIDNAIKTILDALRLSHQEQLYLYLIFTYQKSIFTFMQKELNNEN